MGDTPHPETKAVMQRYNMWGPQSPVLWNEPGRRGGSPAIIRCKTLYRQVSFSACRPTAALAAVKGGKVKSKRSDPRMMDFGDDFSLSHFLPFTPATPENAMRSKQSRRVPWEHQKARAGLAIATNFNTREDAGFLVGSHRPDYAGSAERSESIPAPGTHKRCCSCQRSVKPPSRKQVRKSTSGALPPAPTNFIGP